MKKQQITEEKSIKSRTFNLAMAVLDKKDKKFIGFGIKRMTREKEESHKQFEERAKNRLKKHIVKDLKLNAYGKPFKIKLNRNAEF